MTPASAAPPVRRFPARTASLGFSLRLPAEWPSHALPDEAPDFSDPAQLLPLATVSAPHAAIVFSVAARPAYAEGSLSGWALYLLAQQGLRTPGLGEAVLGAAQGPGGLAAVTGEAERPCELGVTRVRFALFEDGGRLVLLRLSASAAMADVLGDLWQAAIGSFRLDEPAGPTVPLWPPGQRAPMAVPAPPAAPTAMAPDIDVSLLAPAFGDAALSDNTESFDPGHATNRQVREAGAGEVPRLMSVDHAARSATLACAAIQAQIDLPLGWHAADDGRRVLVFEPEGDVHIHIALMPAAGRSLVEALHALQAQLRREHPDATITPHSEGGLHGLALRGLRDADDVVERHEWLVPGPPAPQGAEIGQLLHLRVVAIQACAEAAVRLGERILRSVVFGQQVLPAATGDTGPDWWLAALLLERADRLREAEGCIVGAVDSAGAPLQLAELYRQRMLRLLRAGDPEAAEQARAQSMRWLQRHATLSTGAVLVRATDAVEIPL
ncbi:MAG: hypothetical protein HY855_00655 [Burkholderiales bacterium]|nr:hypothetical protein [Burkholderiales bacterium]